MANPFEEFGGNIITPNPFIQFGGKVKNPGQVTPANVTKIPAKQFMAEYMDSPEYKKRLSTFGVPKPSVQALLNTAIKYDPKEPTHQVINLQTGESYINQNTTLTNKLMKQVYGNSAQQTQDVVMAHELSHQQRELSPQEQIYIGSLNKSQTGKDLFKLFQRNNSNGATFSDFIGATNASDNSKHDDSPLEIKADLDALRYMMHKNRVYDTSQRPMTSEDLNKAIVHPEIKNQLPIKRLLQKLKPEDIINLNNTVAQNYTSSNFKNIS